MKKFIKYLSICIFVIITTFIVTSILVELISTTQITDSISKIGIEKSSSCNTEDIKVTNQVQDGGIWRPVVPGKEVYCVEPGISLYSTVTTSKATIMSYKNETSTSSCGHASNVPHYGQRSATYLVCVGEHYTQSSRYHVEKRATANNGNIVESYWVDNLYDVGYILSYELDSTKYASGTAWEASKQQAIWHSPICEVQEVKNTSNSASGLQIVKEAKEYQSFIQKIESNNGNMLKKDNTDLNNIEFDTDSQTKLHKLGPFNIDYIPGKEINGSRAYGGISDMYLTDKNGKRINIENFIRPSRNSQKDEIEKNHIIYSSHMKPKFFSDHGNANKVDYFAYMSYYPDPNEDFFVEFKYEGDISSLELHVEFSHLECKAEFCMREGTYWEVTNNSNHDHTYNPHTHRTCGRTAHKHGDQCYSGEGEDRKLTCTRREHSHSSSCYSSCHGCIIKTKIVTNKNPQNSVFISNSSREIKVEQMVIKINNPNSKTRMKIGGFVFEDVPAGKESIADGRLNQNNDIKLKNIEVALYEIDKTAKTGKLAELATLKDENPNATKEQINDEKDYTRRINPTLTDENGYYEFRGVDPQKQYYLKFTYNGQTYTCTDYLKDTGYATVKEMVNKDSYQKSVNNNTSVIANDNWKDTSKGTELQKDRKDYDEKFASIYSSPNNYSIKNSPIKLINGDYNKTFNIYELSGITLGSDGKYRYSAADQLIDSNLVVDRDGKITESTKYKDGIISKTIKAYIRNEYNNNENHQYPTNIRNQIYQRIAGVNDDILWEKLQFIEDCKISSYTKSSNTQDIDKYDLYPVYDQFSISTKGQNQYPNNSYESGTYVDVNGSSTDKTVYKNHTLKDNGSGITKVFNTGKQDTTTEYMESKGSITYKNVYPGQLLINQGLWRRQQADISLKKDVYKATLTINGKTETYEYDSRKSITADELKELVQRMNDYEKDRSNMAAYQRYLEYKKQLEDKYWEIQGKMIDYDDYYSEGYNRELYKSDLYFPGDDRKDNQLKAYITYKITVRNQSQSILTRINEIVDYYDEDYEFLPNKSWMMYKEGSNTGNAFTNSNGNEYVTVNDQEFYDIMTGDARVGGNKYKSLSYNANNHKISNADYDNSFAREGYGTIYIDSLKNKKLQSGEEAYLYLTFQIKGKGGRNGGDLRVEKTKTEDGKQNIAEINGYSTFYKDGTLLPNNNTISGENTVAGLIDYDSSPGNFTVEKLTKSNNRYEQNFEDDTDRARGMSVFVEAPTGGTDYMKRKFSGKVWEDKRNTELEDAVIGNGIRESGELGIDNVIVELREVILDENGEPTIDRNGDVITKLAQEYDGNRFYDARKMTTNGGKYEFEGIIPGDYIVRFIYGGTQRVNGKIVTSKYNGQDYKSTSYQVNIDQNGRTDIAKAEAPGYYGYRDLGNYDNNYGQNTSGSYGYNIYKADDNNLNFSDAKDLWRVRKSVNDYSTNNVVHNKASLLDNNKVGHEETEMIAETGVIRTEFEYNRQTTKANTVNGYYHIQNVDLGLEERPKAQLELNKKVSNVKITLANQSVLFDANGQMNNLLWTSKTAYNLQNERKEPNNKVNDKMYKYYGSGVYDSFRNEIANKISDLTRKQKGLIQITMDEEIMHGATIQITYDMTVTNAGEVDYRETQFYYRGARLGVSNKNSIVKTSADHVIDYVSNNLQFRKNSNNSTWSAIEKNTANTKYELNFGSNTNKILEQYNTILNTNGLAKPLVPNEYTETKLVLSQLITSQNKSDDRCYDNISEIVQISNDVGRRMAYSVQGNQNPQEQPKEVDSSIAEQVKILPPFGIGDIVVYIILTIGVLTILTTGIIIIKKKVLK